MTNEEAIKILELERDDWETSHCSPLVRREVFNMAIEALKKQIPIEPGKRELIPDKVVMGKPVYGIPCGNCGEHINFLHSFCPWCGQAIKEGDDG